MMKPSQRLASNEGQINEQNAVHFVNLINLTNVRKSSVHKIF